VPRVNQCKLDAALERLIGAQFLRRSSGSRPAGLVSGDPVGPRGPGQRSAGALVAGLTGGGAYVRNMKGIVRALALGEGRSCPAPFECDLVEGECE